VEIESHPQGLNKVTKESNSMFITLDRARNSGSPERRLLLEGKYSETQRKKNGKKNLRRKNSPKYLELVRKTFGGQSEGKEEVIPENTACSWFRKKDRAPSARKIENFS